MFDGSSLSEFVHFICTTPYNGPMPLQAAAAMASNVGMGSKFLCSEERGGKHKISRNNDRTFVHQKLRYRRRTENFLTLSPPYLLPCTLCIADASARLGCTICTCVGGVREEGVGVGELGVGVPCVTAGYGR